MECDECHKVYKTQKSLKEHKNQVHTEETNRKCNSCGKVFASIVSAKRHIDSCPIRSTKLWEPTTSINSKQNDCRHEHVITKLSTESIELIKHYQRWLENGGFSSVLTTTQKRQLTPKSCSTYAYHLRNYINYIEQAKKNNNDIISYAIEVKTIQDYLRFLDCSQYQAKTKTNKLFAITRFIGFINEELIQLNEKNLTTIEKKSKTFEKKIGDVLKFISNELKTLCPIANRDTLVRNCRESLVAEGKWEDIEVILDKFNGNVEFTLSGDVLGAHHNEIHHQLT
jgi:uncharacterized C2H2 Zn-finger protein